MAGYAGMGHPECVTMTDEIDVEELAERLAEIASTTTDPRAGELLVELVRRLLESAGLPPDDRQTR